MESLRIGRPLAAVQYLVWVWEDLSLSEYGEIF